MTNKRRDFLKTATFLAGGAALGTGSNLQAANARGDGSGGMAAAPDKYRMFFWQEIPAARPAKDVEVLWTTSFPAANGMQVTNDGIWLVDGQTRGPHGERTSHVHLCSHDGDVLRSFRTGGETPSGMTHDGKNLWIAATYSREIIRADDQTGKTLSSHLTPGAGVIYNAPWDPVRRRSPLERPREYPASTPDTNVDEIPGAYREGTGAHGMEVVDGKLWVAVPPARMIYRINPENWMVEHVLPTVHKRPHGIGFQGGYLWESDTDVSTFYKRDPESGEVLDAIRLGDNHPQPHGMSVWNGYIWWVDDIVGNSKVCRMKIPA